MDMKDLNKSQLILLTLLICFVVSIATGIFTVTLMEKTPEPVVQTINTIVQRTIEKVSTPDPVKTDTKNESQNFGDTSALVDIYAINKVYDVDSNEPITSKPLGQGLLISDVGLVMVDTYILKNDDSYNVNLNNSLFQAQVLKKFNNGFTILKITQKSSSEVPQDTDTSPEDSTDSQEVPTVE